MSKLSDWSMFNNRLALVNAIWLTIWHWLMCNGNFITGPYWNDHFNVYFLLNNSRQDKCWMAYRDSLPLKIAWWNYLFLSFACWTVCPVSALVQWKGIFLHNIWSIFLDQDNLVWTHLFPWWNFKPPWTCSGEWTRAKKAKRCRLKG